MRNGIFYCNFTFYFFTLSAKEECFNLLPLTDAWRWSLYKILRCFWLLPFTSKENSFQAAVLVHASFLNHFSKNLNPNIWSGVLMAVAFSSYEPGTVCKIDIFARNGVGHNSQMIALKMAISSNMQGAKKSCSLHLWVCKKSPT